MVVRSVVKSGSYRDSIFLMNLSSQAAKESGAETVSAMMATERNKELFTASGLMTPEIQTAKANDLVIAIRGDEAQAETAVQAVLALLDQAAETQRDSSKCSNASPATIRQASLLEQPDLALVSVAGDYARYEAAEALSVGMDVMLYSDNISLADEYSLKQMAQRKKLLVMGPDCGTAIIDGVPLAFANNVARGPVGIVAASGTGLQEVCCLLDRLGVGISQAYGTGGRDLKDDIGGITTLSALGRLADDPDTEVVVIMGKPPGQKTRGRILDRCRSLGKPVFVHYVGATDYTPEESAGIGFAHDMTELSLVIARHFAPGASLEDPRCVAAVPKTGPGFLCGIFGGGTLCHEAAEICRPLLKGEMASNLSVSGFRQIGGKDSFKGHVFWDLGDDEFTVGRPHPMMAPDLKMDKLTQALLDPTVAVVLMDMVIGHGSHPQQAKLAATAIRRANAGKPVVASVCGTEKDAPARSSEVTILQGAGIIVQASNAIAARYAAELISRQGV